jgi:hypothetical protein
MRDCGTSRGVQACALALHGPRGLRLVCVLRARATLRFAAARAAEPPAVRRKAARRASTHVPPPPLPVLRCARHALPCTLLPLRGPPRCPRPSHPRGRPSWRCDMSGRRKDAPDAAEAAALEGATFAPRRAADAARARSAGGALTRRARFRTGRKRLKPVDQALIPVRALARTLATTAPPRWGPVFSFSLPYPSAAALTPRARPPGAWRSWRCRRNAARRARRRSTLRYYPSPLR